MSYLTKQQAAAVADTILSGFNHHYNLFRSMSTKAKKLFERAQWVEIQKVVAYRIQMYDDRVYECVTKLREEHAANVLNEHVWKDAKAAYIALLVNHKQPELAETFFNSVSNKILGTQYYNNNLLFLKPAISTEYIDSETGNYKTFYPNKGGLHSCLKDMFNHFDWGVDFADLEQDLNNIIATAKNYFIDKWYNPELNFHLKVLYSAFYRNKSAYIFGQIINGHEKYPFAIPILHNQKNQLYIDAVLFSPKDIAVLFSFSRAYFLVEMDVPSGYVNFLKSMLPMRPKSDFYTMLGLQKQSKNIHFREFSEHLRYSSDDFILAPGIKGLVMLVFTLPSFPYVFKVIKDKFGPNKDFNQKYVIEKYKLVKKHDRVGRLADTLEYSNVAIPKERCSPELLTELQMLAPSKLIENDNIIIIKHVYIERRLKPLNIYMQTATKEEKVHAVIEYGNTIKELACANIFPGDMLYKNFGVTRYGRVIFYDYDEIEYMTDCNFRKIPPAPNPEYELSDEVWYPVNQGDVFPEEFGTFLLGDPEVRTVFLKYHRELLTQEFWQKKKDNILAGIIEDFFPYPEDLRFTLTNKQLANDTPIIDTHE